jgi:cell division protein FtsL
MATAYPWIWRGSGPESGELLVAGQSGNSELRKPKLVSQAARHARTITGGGRKPAMVEFYTVKRIDNSRLVRHIEPVRMRSLYRTVALGGIIAVCFMLYIYQHFRCIDLSYQLEDLKGRQEQVHAFNSELKLEIATLRDPHRIDVIARQQLGLTQPTANQVREFENVDGAEVATVQYARPNRAP